MGKLVPNTFNLLVVIAVALGSTACSYGMSVISSTIGQPSFYVDLGLAPQGAPGYKRTSELIGAFNGVNSAGSALAAPVTAWTANKIGRLRTIELGALVTIIGGALCAGSIDVPMFLVARFVAGWGVGTLITAIPMYQAEVSTPESRGFMVSMHGIMFAVGYSLSAWIGFGCYFLSASGSTSSFPWRFPLAFQMVPAAMLLACSKWLPYSPRWLMAQGRMDEAHDVLRKLHRTKEDAHDTLAAKEFYQMRKQLELDNLIKKKKGVFEIFATKANRKRAYVGFTLMVGNEFTGTLIIANYGVLLYQSLGNVFTALFIDRIGRRTFMLIGISGLLVTLCFEAALQAEYLGGSNAAGQKAAVYFLFQFIFFWSTFIDASQYLYLAEIFPTHIRSSGMAVGMFGLYLAAIVILVAGPIGLDVIKWKFFLVLIIPTAFHLANIYFVFPETKQRSLEDINAAFGDEVAVHYYHANKDEEALYAEALAAEEAGNATGIVLKGADDLHIEHQEKV